jgi:hypothetical protein
MWDEAIDAAARAATEGGVPRDFESRVLARIAARPRRSAWNPIALSCAVAAALVLVLAILIVSTRERSNPGASQEAASNGGATTASQPSPAAVSEPTNSTPVDTHVATRESARFTRIPSDTSADLSRDLSSSVRDSSTIEDLTFPLLVPPRIVNDPLTTDPLVTEPITIDTLEMPPLDGQAVTQ